jgi:hypothetical protein
LAELFYGCVVVSFWQMISAMAGLQALLQLLFADAIRHDPASGQQPPVSPLELANLIDGRGSPEWCTVTQPYPTGRYLVEKLQIGAVLGKVASPCPL